MFSETRSLLADLSQTLFYRDYQKRLEGAVQAVKTSDTGLAAVKQISEQAEQSKAGASIGADLRGIAKNHYEYLTRLALMRWALALEVYRKRTGSYPSALQDVSARLGWKLPKDPITGGEFLYRRRPGGCLIYSIGWNGKDDGGRNFRDQRTAGPTPPPQSAADVDDISLPLG
ncbi:MAG: hypothetical protein ACP5R4_10925 [Armatimonadota bacterium]